MNKTVTINISGIVFHIEEDAYDALSRYISQIKGFFKATEGGDEIMADIEARIAELLQGRISASKQVIVMDDVHMVIATMGEPEQFAGTDEAQSTNNKQTYESQQAPYGKVKKRLFRDPDDKTIGGVCSGLAAYFDVDTVWVRLAMVLLVFFGGLSLWVYFVLWIVIPEARTTADKFAMRGEPANINTIFKNFKEEAEDVKARMNKYGKDFRDSNYGNSMRDNIASFLATMFNLAGRIIGFFLVTIGIALLIAYAGSIMGISVASSGSQTLDNWKEVIFESQSDYFWAVFAFVIVLGIPILMMLYGGIKLLFKIRYSNRWLNLSLGVLWTIGFVVGIYVVAVTARNFNENARIKETMVMHTVGDTLNLKLSDLPKNFLEKQFENNDDLEISISKNRHEYLFGHSANNLNVIGYADLTIVYTEGDSVELVMTKSARGRTKRDANRNAKSIAYDYQQDGSTLIFDRCFIMESEQKFRAQEVELVLRVPKGKIVRIDKTLADMLDDVENTSNTYEGDMGDRRWIMTEKGLECIDCQHLKVAKHKARKSDHEEDVEALVIDKDGIRINSENSHIKIDENGIKIKTNEGDYTIKEEHNKTKKEAKKK